MCFYFDKFYSIDRYYGGYSEQNLMPISVCNRNIGNGKIKLDEQHLFILFLNINIDCKIYEDGLLI